MFIFKKAPLQKNVLYEERNPDYDPDKICAKIVENKNN